MAQELSVTVGDVVADPDGKPVEAVEVAAPRSSRGHPMSEAEFNASVAAGTPKAVPPPPVAVPVPLQRPTKVAEVVPPPPDTWHQDTPYADSRSAAAAAWKGFVDPILGTAQFASKLPPMQAAVALSNALGGKASADPFGPVIDRFHDYIAPQHPELSPKTEMTGALANPVGAGVGKGLTIAKIGPWKSGIAAGLAGGAANPVETIKDYWDQKLGDLGWGGGTGAGLTGVTKLVGKVLAPRVQEAIKTLEARGVNLSKLTVGELLGGKMQSFENWVKDALPGSGIGAAQESARREFQVAPLREVGQSVGHAIDEKAPLPAIFSDLVGGVDAHGNPVSGAIADTYGAARGQAPLIAAKAVPNNAGTRFRMNVGSPRVFAPLQKAGDTWAAENATLGKPARDVLASDLRMAMQPFKLDLVKGSYHFADPTDLHDSIKYLGSRIAAENHAATVTDKANPYHYKVKEALTTARDHLRDLWEKTDQGSFNKLRAADKAHEALQAVQDASAKANVKGGAYSPEDLLRASARGVGSKRTAAGVNDYQDYARAGQDVLGPDTAKPTSRLGAFGHLATRAMAPAAGVGAAGAAVMGHPEMAVLGLGALGAAAGATRVAHPVLNRWVTSAYPERQALRTAVEKVPAYLGGVDTVPATVIPEALGGRRRREP